MPERYIQLTTELSNLQLTTSKEGLILSLANRSMSNAEWNTMILNKKQADALTEFLIDRKIVMTDDSLDDVAKGNAMSTEKSELNKIRSVDIEKLASSSTSVYAREIWNAAIEAAAKLGDYRFIKGDEIRTLKK